MPQVLARRVVRLVLALQAPSSDQRRMRQTIRPATSTAPLRSEKLFHSSQRDSSQTPGDQVLLDCDFANRNVSSRREPENLRIGAVGHRILDGRRSDPAIHKLGFISWTFIARRGCPGTFGHTPPVTWGIDGNFDPGTPASQEKSRIWMSRNHCGYWSSLRNATSSRPFLPCPRFSPFFAVVPASARYNPASRRVAPWGEQAIGRARNY